MPRATKARRTASAGSLAIVVALAICSAALARGTPDQDTFPTIGTGHIASPFYSVAQTFTAGRTGYLDTIALALDGGPGRYRLSIQSPNGDGVPSGTVLASRTLDGCRGQREFAFGPATRVTTGQKYAAVLEYIQGSSSEVATQVIWWGSAVDYAGGGAFAKQLDLETPSWQPAFVSDLGITTYVSDSAPPALSRDETTTVVTTERNPSPPGPNSFTAKVTDPSHPAHVPTGAVDFVDSDGRRASVTLDEAGAAAFTPDLAGNRDVTVSATYCPDSDAFEGSAGSHTQTIKQDATSITVDASPSISLVGQPVKLSAQVTNVDEPAATPTGGVRFEFGGSPVVVPLVDGSASTQTSTLPFGDHLITAQYEPDDGFFAPVAGQTMQTTNRSTSTSSLSVAPDPTVSGQPSVFHVKVSGTAFGGQKPSGEVQLIDDDGSSLGPPLGLSGSGEASLATTAGAGIYRVKAAYPGDDRFGPSETTVTQTIRRAGTATTLASTATVVPPGGTFALVTTVTANKPSEWIPDGFVQLSVDGQPLGDPEPLDEDGRVGALIKAPSQATSATFRADYLENEDFTGSAASVMESVVASAPPAHAPGGAGSAVPGNRVSILPGQSLRTLFTAGLKARVSCTGPCRFNHRLTIPKATAERARIGRTIGRGKGRLRRAGRRTTKVRVTSRAVHRLKRLKTLKLTLITNVTRAGRRQVVRTRSTLHRSPSGTGSVARVLEWHDASRAQMWSTLRAPL